MSLGLAQTDRFLFAQSELMLGVLGQTSSLVSSTHSLGLAKDVTIKTDISVKELMQGVTGDVIDTTRVSNTIEVSGKLHEYTPRNLAYLSGLVATATAFDLPIAPTTLTANVAASGTVANVTSATGFAVDDDIVLIRSDRPHSPHCAKVVSIASLAITFTPAVPTTMDFPIALTKVMEPAVMGIGAETNLPSFSCKLVSQIKFEQRPLIALIPKVQVVSGLSLTFGTDDYGGLPFTLKAQTMVPTDIEFAKYVSSSGQRMPGRFLLA